MRTLLLFWAFSVSIASAGVELPRPAKVVIVILENHGYEQIIGSSSAPYINSLAGGKNTALFTSFYAIEHPSQPNYLDLFSGANQGVTNDDLPSGIPFSSANLASALIASGLTFATFSEDLPEMGSLVFASGAYARKHNPASFWQGTGTNQLPPETNRPFSDFPQNYSLLPTVSFVVPNLENDMHNGADPERIVRGDNWVRENMDAYAQWAVENNGLLVITFDEDDGCCGNRIPTLIVGESVQSGSYSDSYSLFSLLRTVEDMYGLTHSGAASAASPLKGCWITSSAAADELSNNNQLEVYPNPAIEFIEICANSSNICTKDMRIFDALGNEARLPVIASSELDCLRVDVSSLSSGVYCAKCNGFAGTFVIFR